MYTGHLPRWSQTLPHATLREDSRGMILQLKMKKWRKSKNLPEYWTGAIHGWSLEEPSSPLLSIHCRYYCLAPCIRAYIRKMALNTWTTHGAQNWAYRKRCINQISAEMHSRKCTYNFMVFYGWKYQHLDLNITQGLYISKYRAERLSTVVF